MVGIGVDQYPQMMRIKIDESAANTFTDKKVDTPVMEAINGKFHIMNIIRVWTKTTAGDMVAGDQCAIALYDRARTVFPGMGDEGCIAADTDAAQISTNGGNLKKMGRWHDLSDGNGHGHLYAKRSIYAGIQGTSQGSALSGEICIQYTMVTVSAEEYIGIVSEVVA